MAIPSDKIALFTSVPPNLVRMVDGVDVGAQYQLDCMRSWDALGFPVTSLNPILELHLLATRFPNLRTVAVPRAQHPAITRPLVALNDLLDRVLDDDAEVIVLVNADIELAGFKELRSTLEGVTAGHALVGQRMELVTPDSTDGQVCTAGFDVFAIHRNDLSQLRTYVPLFIGAPWWDYHMVAQLVLNTISVNTLDPKHIHHLSHSGGWSIDLWNALGVEFGRDLLKRIRRQGSEHGAAKNARLTVLLKEFELKIRRGQRPAFKAAVRQLVGHSQGILEMDDLHRFAALFTEFITSDLIFVPPS